MKIRRVKNQTPESSPPSSMADGGAAGEERFVWEALVPRLLHPTKLVIIRSLLRERRPLSLGQLAETAEITVAHAHHHCKSMQREGVLEVVGVAPRPDGQGEEPSYYFPSPPQSPPSRSAEA